MNTIPLAVLVHEGPCARAYLTMMRRAGLQPERIIVMVPQRDPRYGKPIGRYLPPAMRTWYCGKVQEHAQNHWPRAIARTHPEIVTAVERGLNGIIDDAGGLVREMLGRFDYGQYAPRVERVLVAGYRDPRLADALHAISPATVLFTGGGILPGSLIDLAGVRFLHVHPGLLPHVRGADGLLWSTLVRGRPAMSCFFLAKGLDTGDVVATREYPPLQFDLCDGARPDNQTLYRAVFSFIDPLLRADTLIRDVLQAQPDVSRLPARPQDAGRGVTYHFMHAALREHVLRQLFTHSHAEARSVA